MKKKMIVYALLVFVLVFSFAYAKSFSDVDGSHWANSVINNMVSTGILNGYPDGTFKPNNPISRAEFAKILVLSLDLKDSSHVDFEDVGEDFWGYEYIMIANNYLPASSVGNKRYYHPDEALIREEVARAMVLAVGLQNDSYYDSTLDRFSDKSKISEDNRKYVAIAVENGIMKGNADGTFNPKGNLTRAEVCQLVFNVDNHIVANPTPIPTKEGTFTEDEFASTFMKKNVEEGKNFVYSPLSIKYALKMLSDGSAGNTKEQIDTVVGGLKVPKYDDVADKISLANAIFINNAHKSEVDPEYANLLNQKYHAVLLYDAFQNAKNINKWVEEKTLGILKDALPDDFVEPRETVLALVNALGIDLKWVESYSEGTLIYRRVKAYEENGNYFGSYGGEFVKCVTGTSKGDDIAYYEDEEVTALRMQLEKVGNTDLVFYAIKPNTTPLVDFAKDYKISNLTALDAKMIPASKEPHGVTFKVPKFDFRSDMGAFVEALMSMGITDAFGRDADLSPMQLQTIEGVTMRDWFVKKAAHIAKIEFSEEGIKAAAVTSFSIAVKSAMPPMEQPKTVNIDDPFLFMIFDKNHNEVWFMGVVDEVPVEAYVKSE